METLVKMSALCRDNLLINSDYKSGIINQIGYEGYRANGGYTIDMWQVQGSGAITLKTKEANDSGKVVVFWKDNNVDGEARYRQILSEERKGTFTFSVYLAACTKEVEMYVVDTDNNIYRKQVYMGLNSMTFTGKIKEVGLMTSKISGSCYIDFLKLEYGKIFTGMPVWNHAVELLKCKRYLQVISKRIYLPQFYQNQYTGFSLEVEMAKIPTVYNVQLLDSWDASLILDGTITMTNKNHIDRVFAPSTYNRTYVILHKAIFDAYTY